MMFNSFSIKHPWLSRKIKKGFWNLLNYFGVTSYEFRLVDSNIRFIVNPQDDSVGKFIFFNNYELETICFSSKFINIGDQVLDIGANIGYFTMLFSACVGDTGEVHSFEPSRREFFHLCKNIINNQIINVYPNQVAISDKNGYSEMNVLDDDRYGAYNSINNITHWKVKLAKSHTEAIRILKIDTYLDLFPMIRPSLIKIDVEGHEKQVLEGMQTLLSGLSAPCLILEVCEGTHQDRQNGAHELLEYLRKFDYELYSPDNEGNLSLFVLGKSLNCIALKPSHSQRLLEKNIHVI